MHVTTTAASGRYSPYIKTTKAFEPLVSLILLSAADAIKVIVAKNIDWRKDELYDC